MVFVTANRSSSINSAVTTGEQNDERGVSQERLAWTQRIVAARTLAVAGQTCSYNFQQDFEQLTRLTNEFDPTRGDGDAKTELIAEGFSDTTDQRHETYYSTHTVSCPGGGYNGLCCAANTDNFFRT